MLRGSFAVSTAAFDSAVMGNKTLSAYRVDLTYRVIPAQLMACFNWFAAETGKEPIVMGSGDARTAGRVEQLLNDWVRLSRGKALAANGKVFEGRDQILSLLSK